MARIGQEGPGVGQHADEAAEHADVGQGLHLGGHAVEVVVEPPGRAELDLAGGALVLEAARRRDQLVVVRGVEGVQNGFRQLVPCDQAVQQGGQGAGGDGVPDGVAAHVRAQGAVQPAGQVALGTQMQLHGEALAIGMAAEVLLSARLGYMSDEEAERVIALYDRVGLPTRIPEYIDREALIKKLYTDKKVRDGKLRFVLQKGIGDVVEFAPGVFAKPIEESLAREIIMEL